MQVLVVDDDPLMVDIASRALRVGGYQVDGVLSGEAAIRAMAIQKPQLVVLDARMPIMSGFDLLKLMKSDRQLADIPVIMLTGLRAKADVLKAGELGAAA